MKRSKFLLLVVLFSACLFNGNAEELEVVSKNKVNESILENSDAGGRKVLNPLWEKYNSLSDEEKVKWEIVPSKYILPFSVKPSIMNNSYKTFSASEELPSSFDLRNVNGKSYVTPNKNQGQLGICWAFSFNSSLESNILMSEYRTYDNPALFSERQLDYISASPLNNATINGNMNLQVYEEGVNPYSIDRRLGDGGNFYYAAFYAGMGLAVQDASGKWETYSEQLETVSLNDVFNLENESYIATDYVFFPSVDNSTANEQTKEAWRKNIKKHIIENGAVFTGTVAPQTPTSWTCYVGIKRENDSYVEENMGLINWNSACEEGTAAEGKTYDGLHAMSIIGWDDNYEKNYCAFNGDINSGYSIADIPKATCESNGGTYYEVNGAWILKNSWGEQVKYIYLAYDSKITEAAGIVKTVEKDFDNTYNIYATKTEITSGYGRENIFYKNREVELLKRVSFEVGTDTELTYSVYLSSKGNPNSIKIGEVQTNLPGRYSIDFENIELTEDNFIISVKPSISNASYLVSRLYAFTNNTDSIRSVNTIFELSEESYGNEYKYNIYSRGKNIDESVPITYVLKDSANQELGTITGAYLIAGTYEGSVIYDHSIGDGLKYIETYIGDELVGRNVFTTNPGLDGAGTSENPYLLKTIGDFNYLFAYGYNDKYYKLNNDIDLSGYINFRPIDLEFDTDFYGELDGDNYTISNINAIEDYAGLFYKLNGTISNLNIDNINLQVFKLGGSIAASGYNADLVNIKIHGSIKANMDDAKIGGAVGSISKSHIGRVYTHVDLDGGIEGALVGKMTSSSVIENSFNLGNFINPNNTITSFVGEFDNSSNRLNTLIDYAGRSCTSSVSKPNGLEYIKLYYYGLDNCNYAGIKLDYESSRRSSTYDLDNNIWKLEDGKYPLLKGIDITFTEYIDINNEIKNIFVGDEITLDILSNQNIVTYPGLTFKSSDESVATISESGIINTLKEGLTSIKISSIDNSHTDYTLNLLVFAENENATLDNTYRVFKDGLIDEDINTYDGITLKVDNPTKRIGTGSLVKYISNGKVLGEFTAIVYGDVSGDGIVGSDDILIARRYIIGADTLNSEQVIAGDILDNGISSASLLMMRRYILGLESEL